MASGSSKSTTHVSPNYINHIAFVLDMSASMTPVARDLVRVADAEITHLARRSQELDQETRVTIYVFNRVVECVVYDKDVLRLPSIAKFYQPMGMTALVDATLKSQEDLARTAQLYGDHAFLTYVLTDGEENSSSRSHLMLSRHLNALPNNWTVACLVPDELSKLSAKQFGFPENNVAIWDATTARGVEDTFSNVIRQATETFMTGRVAGVRGSKTIFAGGTDKVNRDNVKASQGFKQLPKDSYQLFSVLNNYSLEIRPYVTHVTGREYVTGQAYYELTKPEKIQVQKSILVRNRKSGRVYVSDHARALLNLPDHEIRVKPEDNPEYQIFVQSTSVNRKLVPGTKLLVLTT